MNLIKYEEQPNDLDYCVIAYHNTVNEECATVGYLSSSVLVLDPRSVIA